MKPTNSLLTSFNLGLRTTLKWPELSCAHCKRPWSSGSEPTICIACSNATCSSDCHLALQDQKVCTFFTNFTPITEVYESTNGFRAILYRSILAAEIGQRVTYASPRFMSAVKYDSEHVMIQRGFRQYGNPVAEAEGFMKVIEKEPDYEHRICTCDCEKCQGSVHPVYNCLTWCLKSAVNKAQYIECWCICSECIQKGAHSVKDCFYSCKLKKLDNTKN